MMSHFSVSENGGITTSPHPFFPGMGIIFFSITWEERCDLMVKSTRKKIVLLLINLRDPIMWCIGADSLCEEMCFILISSYDV